MAFNPLSLSLDLHTPSPHPLGLKGKCSELEATDKKGQLPHGKGQPAKASTKNLASPAGIQPRRPSTVQGFGEQICKKMTEWCNSVDRECAG